MRLATLALPLLLVACAAPPSLTAPPDGGAPLAEAVAVRGGRADAVTYERARTDRILVRTATLALRAEDEEMPGLRDRAAALAESFGGYVAADGPREMTLRIPDPELEAALDGLGALAHEARREIRAADVTDQYTDLEIRLANARALRQRLADLLERAETVEDVLEVERELSRVTTEVERLEGQLRGLQDRVAFATVRLVLTPDVDPGPLGYVAIGVYEAVKWLFVWD